MVGARRIIVTATRGIGKCKIRIINLLELLGSSWALWGIRRDAIRVRFQRLS